MKAMLGLSVLCAAALSQVGRLALDFEGALPQGWVAEGTESVPGRSGQGLWVGPGARLSLPAPEFLPQGLDLTLWVCHRQAMADLRFEELVYLYHDTPDMRNRICLMKRIGTDRIVFAMTDSTGTAKGAIFAGNWFALQSRDLAWEANSWHALRITASRAQGRAALYVDGEQVAAAEGTQFPEVAGTLCIGNWSGRSQALATFDDITIAPAGQ